MKYEKAGIIVTVFLILLVIILIAVFNIKNKEKSEDVGTKDLSSVETLVEQGKDLELAKPSEQIEQSTDTNVTTTNEVPTTDMQQNNTVNSIEPDVAQTGVSTGQTGNTPVSEPTSAKVEIDINTLNDMKSIEKEEVMTLVKKVLLLDTQSNQLVHTLVLKGIDGNILNYSVSSSVYDSLNLNEDLAVKYREYTNSNGLKFSLIVSIVK